MLLICLLQVLAWRGYAGGSPRGCAVILSIVRHRDVWTVAADGRRLRHFDYQIDAEEAALRLAEEARKGDPDVQVLAQDQWGEVRRIS